MIENTIKRLLFLLLGASFFVTACQGQPTEVSGGTVNVSAGGKYTNINAQEMNAMLKSKDFVLVNVHVPFEGDIIGTDLSIAYDQIADPANLIQLPSDKNAKILLYCRSGRMSAIAAEELVLLGYTNIWNLDGGMVDWEQAGYELEQ